MKDEWLKRSIELTLLPAHLWAGGRKIIRNHLAAFGDPRDTDLRPADAGYTKAKMKALDKAYFVEESVNVASDLWEERREIGKYGSVGFHTYGHLIKGHSDSSRIASKMGPCIQAVTITLLDKKRAEVTAFYRTTEFYKKFPADLMFISDVMEDFDLSGLQVNLVAQFANVTLHPMYFITLLPHIGNHAVEALAMIEQEDPTFHSWVVKWLHRYLVDDKAIRKYAQAMRVRDTALEAISPAVRKELATYLRKKI